jgi:hypothetical protein
VAAPEAAPAGLAEFLKAYLIPGSESLLLGLAAGALCLHLREPIARWGKRWLTLLAATYPEFAPDGEGDEAALDLELNPLTAVRRSHGNGDRGAWQWHGVLPHSERTISELSDSWPEAAGSGAAVWSAERAVVIVSGGSIRGRRRPAETEPMQELLLPASAERIRPIPSRAAREQAVNLARCCGNCGRALPAGHLPHPHAPRPGELRAEQRPEPRLGAACPGDPVLSGECAPSGALNASQAAPGDPGTGLLLAAAGPLP